MGRITGRVPVSPWIRTPKLNSADRRPRGGRGRGATAYTPPPPSRSCFYAATYLTLSSVWGFIWLVAAEAEAARQEAVRKEAAAVSSNSHSSQGGTAWLLAADLTPPRIVLPRRICPSTGGAARGAGRSAGTGALGGAEAAEQSTATSTAFGIHISQPCTTERAAPPCDMFYRAPMLNGCACWCFAMRSDARSTLCDCAVAVLWLCCGCALTVL